MMSSNHGERTNSPGGCLQSHDLSLKQVGPSSASQWGIWSQLSIQRRRHNVMLPEPPLSDMKIHLGDKLKTEGAKKPARSLCLIHALQLHSLHVGLFFQHSDWLRTCSMSPPTTVYFRWMCVIRGMLQVGCPSLVPPHWKHDVRTGARDHVSHVSTWYEDRRRFPRS